MRVYYVAGYAFGGELAHHGIKGQKWGIRRYQNEDGTLTAEGKRRYGDSLGERATGRQGVIRRLATGDWALGGHRFSERFEQRNYRKADEARARGDVKKAESHKEIGDIQRKRNVDIDRYNSRTSTGKLVAQSLLFGQIGANSYRASRERGETRGKAAVVGILANLPYGGGVLSVGTEFYKAKRAYGSGRD